MVASGLGTLIVLAITGLIKLMMIIGLIGMSDSTATKVVGDSFLKLDLTKPVYERGVDKLEAMLNSDGSVGLNDMLRAINSAADDKRIKGIYIYMGSTYQLSWGMSEELRQALAEFRKSGKPVLVYADTYSQQGYFLASVADSIYLNPSGMVEFRGIGAEALFFKDMLDKLAVKMTLIRPNSNSFKSAGEMYTMDHMSEANKTQVREYIADIWDYAVEQIALSRGTTSDALNMMADSLSACLPNDAAAHGLVDRLCFEGDISNTLREVYHCKNITQLSDYVTSLPISINKNRIAVIYAEGDVVIGTGFGRAVYSDKITKALNDAADDPSVKAIVLRVNSPGGMVTASEVMTDAVARAKAKKPVVVSMSDVAASAGYEISCNASCIVAEPTTITGSIGVFATIPEVGGTLKKYLGITTDTLKTNTNSTALSILRPMSPEVLALMQRNVEEFYTTFVSRVANGRNLDNDYVDSIARGRVWTGRKAYELGLVDTLGGIQTAIAIAAHEAGIGSNYQVMDYPLYDGLLENLLNRTNSSGTLNSADLRQQAPNAMYMPAASGDGVWVAGRTMIDMLNRICDSRDMQARVEFFLITD